MKTKKEVKEKYLDDKIGLIQASIAGAIIGANILGLDGNEYHYDYGKEIRKIIEKDIRNLYKYAIKKGRQQSN